MVEADEKNESEMGQSIWPECGWRIETNDSAKAFCENSKVRVPGNIVTQSVCATCDLRGMYDEATSRKVLASSAKRGCCGPSLVRKAWNLTKAMAAFLADGARVLDESQYRVRLEICDTCNRRQDNECLECGCRLSLKAKGRAFDCPLKKWPKLDAD